MWQSLKFDMFYLYPNLKNMSTNREKSISYFRSAGLDLTYNTGRRFIWELERPGLNSFDGRSRNMREVWAGTKLLAAQFFYQIRLAQLLIHEIENGDRDEAQNIRSWYEGDCDHFPNILREIDRRVPSGYECLPYHWKSQYKRLSMHLDSSEDAICGQIMCRYLSDREGYYALSLLFPKQGATNGKRQDQTLDQPACAGSR